MAIDVEAPGANEAALNAALKDRIGRPTRTTATLSGSSTDVAIPAGCTYFYFTTPTGIGTNGHATTVYGGSTEQTWTGDTNNSVLSSGTAFAAASSSPSMIHGWVFDPRNSANKTLANSQSGNLRRVTADSAQDESILRFKVSSGELSGTAEIMWFYN